MSHSRILIVDDEPQIRRVLRATLTSHEYEVHDARNGQEALERLRETKPDLILLDMNMPGMTGLETCREIRATSEAAIIMLTVRSSEADIVTALDAGADDYITKPFSLPMLLARIRAALRRVPIAPETGGDLVEFGGIRLQAAARRLTVQGKEVRLTPKEFDLLHYLAMHPDVPVTHAKLLQAVWGPDYGNQVEYLRVFINQLRKKIEPDPAKPRYLLTEPWVGYRLHMPIAS